MGECPRRCDARERTPPTGAKETRRHSGATAAPTRRGRRVEAVADRRSSPENRELGFEEQGVNREFLRDNRELLRENRQLLSAAGFSLVARVGQIESRQTGE